MGLLHAIRLTDTSQVKTILHINGDLIYYSTKYLDKINFHFLQLNQKSLYV